MARWLMATPNIRKMVVAARTPLVVLMEVETMEVAEPAAVETTEAETTAERYAHADVMRDLRARIAGVGQDHV